MFCELDCGARSTIRFKIASRAASLSVAITGLPISWKPSLLTHDIPSIIRRPEQHHRPFSLHNTDLHGFTNLQPYLYLSCNGETVEGPCHGVPNPNNQQWSFSFGNGFLGTDILQNPLYVMVYYPSPHGP